MSDPIYLIGFPGSGKTTFGKRLAIKLNKQFIDLDDEVAKSNGYGSVALLISNTSMTHFRELETSTLLALSNTKDTVIACGGGTPCFNDNMKIIKESGLSIYIAERSREILFKRLSAERPIRPLVEKLNPRQLLRWIKTELKKREPYYSQADVTIKAESMVEFLRI